MTAKSKQRKTPAAETVEPTAVPNEESRKLIDAADALGFAKSYVEAIFMAAGSLSLEQRGAISSIADSASNKIQEAISLLEEYREQLGMYSAQE